MHRILLDVTRLYTRKRASTPSGIDRVDLRYLEHFDSEKAQYVVAWLGCFFIVEKPQLESLREGLSSKWQQGDTTKKLPTLLNLIKGSALELLWVTLRNLLPQKWGVKQKYSSSFRRFFRESEEPWLYINTSHVQIRSIDALAGLKHHLSVQFLFFIHDLIPITHREYVRPGGAAQHEKRLELLDLVGAEVIANSDYTKSELLNWLQQNNKEILSESITVNPIGVEPEFQKSLDSISPESQPYFLMLGTIEPRKNHLLALNVWRRFVEQRRENIPKLMIIGKRGWENENIVDMLERCDPIQPYLIEKQHVSDEELKAYLAHCEALIYPSFVEGWGMPVAEALAMGKKVICSDIPPFNEVGQGIPIYIDPLNGVDLMEAVDSLNSWSMETAQNTYQAPSWEAHMDTLDSVIQNI